MQNKIIFGLMFLILSAVSVHGENAMDYFNLGVKSTVTRTKIKYFTKALELNPNLAEAYQQRGMLYFFQEKYDHVIEDFQAYIRLAAPKAEAYRMLGMGYLKSGFYERAIDKFSRAIEMEPELFAIYANRAEAYRLSGKYEETIRDSTISIKMIEDRRTQSDANEPGQKLSERLGETILLPKILMLPGI